MVSQPNKVYPFQLCFASVFIVAPLLWLLLGWIKEDINGEVTAIPLFIFFGFFGCLPTLFVCNLAFKFLIKKRSSVLLLKGLIAGIAVAGVWITFAMISGSMALMLSWVYSASIVIASFFCRMKQKGQANF